MLTNEIQHYSGYPLAGQPGTNPVYADACNAEPAEAAGQWRRCEPISDDRIIFCPNEIHLVLKNVPIISNNNCRMSNADTCKILTKEIQLV